MDTNLTASDELIMATYGTHVPTDEGHPIYNGGDALHRISNMVYDTHPKNAMISATLSSLASLKTGSGINPVRLRSKRLAASYAR